MKRENCIRECKAASCASSLKFWVSDSGLRTGEKSFFLGVTPPPPRTFDATVTCTGDLTPGPAITEPVDVVRVEDEERCGDNLTTAARLDLAFTRAASGRDLDFPYKSE